MTTIGQLVSELYSQFERRFHDEKRAAIATQRAVDDILRRTRASRTNGRSRT